MLSRSYSYFSEKRVKCQENIIDNTNFAMGFLTLLARFPMKMPNIFERIRDRAHYLKRDVILFTFFFFEITYQNSFRK